jgi:tRNA A37 methylthiotransferase MiaB
MQVMLRDSGWALSDDPAAADLVIFNACALTEYSQECSIEFIRRLKRKLSQDARLVVCGCLARISPERLRRVYDGPTFGSDDFAALAGLLGLGSPSPLTAANHLIPYTNGQTGLLCRLRDMPGILDPYSLLAAPYGKEYSYWAERINLIGPAHWYIKAATGCMNHCAYCAVKIARGDLRSKPISTVAAELRTGLQKGFQIFSLIGSDLGCYGRDQGATLVDLLRALTAEPGDFRLKIRNVHPRYLIAMLPELAELLRTGKIDFLMTAAQSGNDRVLQAMQRGYRVEEFKHAIRTLRHAWPRLEIRTQIMAGYPGETEAEFEDSLRLIEELDFDFVEAYSFSPRPGTKAFSLPGRLSSHTLRRRSYRLLQCIVNQLRAKHPAAAAC